VLGLQRGDQDFSELPLIFDDENTHQGKCYRPTPAPILTFVSGEAADGNHHKRVPPPGCQKLDARSLTGPLAQAILTFLSETAIPAGSGTECVDEGKHRHGGTTHGGPVILF
jgi:hypothetical protein